MVAIKTELYGLYSQMTTEQLTQLLANKEWQLRTRYTDFPHRKAENIAILKEILNERSKNAILQQNNI